MNDDPHPVLKVIGTLWVVLLLAGFVYGIVHSFQHPQPCTSNQQPLTACTIHRQP